MTPNGAIAAGFVLTIAAIIIRDPVGLLGLAGFVVVFGLAGGGIVRAVLWTAGIVLPLAAFMALVWVGFVGRPPHEVAGAASRIGAAIYVAVISLRLGV